MRRAKELLRRVGLGDRLDHYPVQLSGGEQQRVALARAFITKPPILPTSPPAISMARPAAGARTALELNRMEGATLVLVTHDPALAGMPIASSRCAMAWWLRMNWSAPNPCHGNVPMPKVTWAQATAWHVRRRHLDSQLPRRKAGLGDLRRQHRQGRAHDQKYAQRHLRPALQNEPVGLLEAGRVQSVGILYVPVIQNVNLNPERLQKGYAYKIVAARFSGSREASL